ncbi:hydroxymethylbilane synthase [Tenacibaculum maritimum]|uniref:hydroxymethylbilane synthase n=1 Tax=Tenacibaculum maritimum TaxID=107401 RepID=UPI0012E571F8|nr:hydroxymethylbilane synthase [Tenacibaculum maritimum]CAA0157177.1 porphobilinogen deaminase (hydroxymethylbilane synthase) and uroporphyrinogen-III synthase [Tenacibaculum maritimum]CAA0187421.1 porphobilinogen deaminase (hydroxymethylbilane synthase) and uroporphyrinogen-III synthase [Tenacibaculum maritimum]CAA0190608.1 porphobilinogen deaminase (hydroxymethylbilane synthase) and uroporphyrinogen-III synthase [Tenacibaculum maritimum]CAA0193911.1 porphobilinogen deaminase (hydroxymethylbi
MQKTIRIGTRDSQLALWQANKVRNELNELGYETAIVPIKSTGDIVLDKPLYELGITGIFTKNLDIAMLNGDIDVAVHSLKDVPTVLPEGIIQAAVLKRANYNDILVLKDNEEFFAQPNGVIATGSLRRKAQWLNRYPTHEVVDLRGNVNTRLQKLRDNEWNGAVFAAAGLERIGLRPKGAINLSWMIPAPAQGTIMITALEEDDFVKDACEQLNHYETQVCTNIEREFLNRLEGGCTAPIGALAYIDEKTEEINFKGVLLSRDGKKKLSVTKNAKLGRHRYLAKDCADYIINRGGKQIMAEDEGLEREFAIYSTKKLSEMQKKLLPISVNIEDSDFIKTRFNRIAPKIVKNEIRHIIITSKNGVEAILHNFSPEELQFKNIYCVGRRTKKLIEQKIGKVAHSERNAEKLAAYLSDKIKGEEVTYFCSNLRLETLPKVLAENNIVVNEVEVYKTMYSPVQVAEKVNGILFYSPSTVASYIEKNKANKIAFCIGESTAKEARKHFENVQVANVPTVESVIEMVNLHFVKK